MLNRSLKQALNQRTQNIDWDLLFFDISLENSNYFVSVNTGQQSNEKNSFLVYFVP